MQGFTEKKKLGKTNKRKVLKSSTNTETRVGVNKGFRAHEGRVFTYVQKRFGLSYMYCKRLVNDDGISTEPLDL